MSMIVPLSLVSTQRMKSLQQSLEAGRDCWYSNFAWRPGKLFDTVNRALSIFVTAGAAGHGETLTTGYLKWHSIGRDHLIPTVRFGIASRDRSSFWVPKLGDDLEVSILAKIQSVDRKMQDFTLAGRGVHSSGNAVYYRTTGGLYWKIFTDFAPAFTINGIPGKSSRQTNLYLREKSHIRPAVAILSSSLFWWWYTVTSNLRDLNPVDWQHFPVTLAALDDARLASLGAKYIKDLKRNSEMHVRQQKRTGRTETQLFKISKSKPIIDQIDTILACHYELTEEELDFIINYDIKYRMSGET